MTTTKTTTTPEDRPVVVRSILEFILALKAGKKIFLFTAEMDPKVIERAMLKAIGEDIKKGGVRRPAQFSPPGVDSGWAPYCNVWGETGEPCNDPNCIICSLEKKRRAGDGCNQKG